MMVRGALVGALCAIATVLALRAAFQERWAIRWPLAVLAVTVWTNLHLMNWLDPSGHRHFSGFSASLAILRLLVWAGERPWFARGLSLALPVGAIGILTVGLAGVEFLPVKFVIGSESFMHLYISPHLPRLQYDVPGLTEGKVNLNALGGTALIVLPLVIGAYGCAKRLPLRAARVLSTLAALVCLAVIILSVSRTVFYGTLLLGLIAVILAFRWRGKYLKLTLLSLLIAVMLAGLATRAAWQREPELWDQRAAQITETLKVRTALWQQAGVMFLTSPVIGIGLNRFDDLIGGDAPPAHAHNQLVQVALDVGIVGLLAYVSIMVWAISAGLRGQHDAGPQAALTSGAALALVALHIFGVTDAIALGSKVGVAQWLSVGVILVNARNHESPVPPPQ